MSSIRGITYPIATLLAHIIQPVVGKNGYHILNDEKVKNITLSEEETLISFDVTALFTSAPVLELKEIVKNLLIKDHSLEPTGHLTPNG